MTVFKNTTAKDISDIKIYTGEKVSTKGKLPVIVKYKENQKQLKL